MALPQLPPVDLSTEQWNHIHSGNDFPNLDYDEAKALGPETTVYNCIAWSIGVTNNRYNPSECFLTITAMIAWYEARGYESCTSAEAEVNGGVDGWALNGTPTHASRYYNEGGHALGWTSKVGNNALIQHPRDSLRGPLYGAIDVHFRPRATSPISVPSTVQVETGDVEAARAEVHSLAAKLSSSFPGLTQRFRDLWDKFYGTYVHGNSSDDKSYLKGKEWEELLKLGPSVLPLVVEKALDPKSTIACQLYETLQSDPTVRVTPEDKTHLGSNQQAQRVVVLYAQQLNIFNEHVKEWQMQQSAKSNSSFDDDFTHRCQAFHKLVGMDKSIISAIMTAYMHDQTGWWHELLHVIIAGTHSPPGPVNKVSLYYDWKDWFEKGDPLTRVPKRGSAAPAAA